MRILWNFKNTCFTEYLQTTAFNPTKKYFEVFVNLKVVVHRCSLYSCSEKLCEIYKKIPAMESYFFVKVKDQPNFHVNFTKVFFIAISKNQRF